jgi:2-dehydro-3-deoxyphosphogluconate aldolase/(4S)-4-hydroxy-2-oxoglutarate aldolase
MSPLARPDLPAAIREGRIVAIARRQSPERVLTLAGVLADAGIRALELTLDSPAAVELISAVAARFDPDRLTVGAGTVLDVDAAAASAEAGARFLVSPHLDPDLVAWAAGRGLPMLPGAMTPTEVLQGWRSGAAAVKVFPASAVGPAFIRELRGPLPGIPLLPTGGVTLETVPAFLGAGAVAVGIGSWLTAVGDEATLRERARVLARVAEASDGAAGGR